MPTLLKLRKDIEKIDATIIRQLARRQKISRQVGRLKKKTEKRVRDTKREAYLRAYYKRLCAEHGLPPALILGLFRAIIAHSRSLQVGR